jgi:hypothetical protein
MVVRFSRMNHQVHNVAPAQQVAHYGPEWLLPMWINGLGADDKPVLARRHYLYGIAFSGDRGRSLESVELVGPDLGPNAWRRFKHQVDLSLGKTRYVSRATDMVAIVSRKNANRIIAVMVLPAGKIPASRSM